MDLNSSLTQIEDPSAGEALSRANTAFALDLYAQLRGSDGNLFFSPYSISSALALTYAGAAGDTRSQMEKALHFPENGEVHAGFSRLRKHLVKAAKNDGVDLKIANSLWPLKGDKFLKEYLSLVRKAYGARITPLDFSDSEAARNRINAWVEDKTEGRIKEIVTPGSLDAMTRLVLVNAIYFKADWTRKFNEAFTQPALFFTGEDQPPEVQLMKQESSFRYAHVEDLQVLELPYASGAFSMLVLLPDEFNGLEKLEASLSPEKLDLWLNSLAETDVEVFLPRFELSYPFRLDGALKALGMTDAFSEAADFSGMNGAHDLYLGAVLHKAFVAVNETGTEAAAATLAVMVTKGLSFPAANFRADHPFLFLLRDNASGSLLFMGRLVRPESKG